ncbi:MAG: tetratricopeptide repeat protein [Hyphomicrobiaceae bacterium]
MSDMMLGALLALSILAIAIWILEPVVPSRLSAPATSGTRPADRLSKLALERWPVVVTAAVIALGVAGATGQQRGLAPASATASAEPTTATGELAATYDRLRTFAADTQDQATSVSQSPIPQASGNLPDVDTMITKLAARLETDPSDGAGWRMLGWSYFHTERYAEAVEAYERALALLPEDAEIKAALAEAKSAKDGTASGPTPSDMAAAADLSEEQRQEMIAGMVARLADRLAVAPRDEDGWVKLMRSRMVLKQPDAAASDLAKAKQAFAGDTAVLERLTSVARTLGVPGA